MIDLLVADHDALRDRLRQEFRTAAEEAIAARGFFAIALSGGSIGQAFFPALAQLPVDWSRVHFFWVDERAVPPSDPESNYGLANRLWLQPTHVPAQVVHRMPADRPDLAVAAFEYSGTLSHVLGRDGRLDIALLGMGPDGHIASLFAGHAGLAIHDRYAIAITDSPKPPPRRLTLTLPILASARTAIVAALGTSKSQALADAIGNPDSLLPVAQLLHRNKRPLVLADTDAGGFVARGSGLLGARSS